MNGFLSEKGTPSPGSETGSFDERKVIRTRRCKPPPKGVYETA